MPAAAIMTKKIGTRMTLTLTRASFADNSGFSQIFIRFYPGIFRVIRVPINVYLYSRADRNWTKTGWVVSGKFEDIYKILVGVGSVNPS